MIFLIIKCLCLDCIIILYETEINIKYVCRLYSVGTLSMYPNIPCTVNEAKWKGDGGPEGIRGMGRQEKRFRE